MKNNRSLGLDEHITKVLQDPNKIMRSLRAGIKAALLQHKRAGNPICIWRDNKVVWIPADEIPVIDKVASSKKNAKSKKVAVKTRKKLSNVKKIKAMQKK